MKNWLWLFLLVPSLWAQRFPTVDQVPVLPGNFTFYLRTTNALASGFRFPVWDGTTNRAVEWSTLQGLLAPQSLTVRESDGTPSVSSVNEIRVTDGKLTSLGGGAVLLDLTGGGAGSGDSGSVNGSAVTDFDLDDSTTIAWTLNSATAPDTITAAVQNISNTHIAAGADIARSKIQEGTANHVVINDGSGNLSSEATLGAARFPALTGDLTTPGGSLATTIAANAVTFAKMADLATDRLIGRDTTGTGDPEAITVGGGLEFTGSGGIQRSALTGAITAAAGSGVTTLATDSVGDSNLRNSAALSVIGRAVNSIGDPADIVALANGTVLKRVANTLTFAAVDLAADITGNLPVANLGSGTGAGATTFWRGDGSWALPLADGDKGDITVSGSGATWTIDVNSVALGSDTVGNYVSDVDGTANEVTVTHTPGEGSTATVSLPLTIDLGGKTSLELPNSAAPVTDVFGEVAGDNNAWAVGRGAIQAFDGTANIYLLGALVSDVPSAGQVPKFNADGTITWEIDNNFVSDGNKGDITVSGSGATWVVNADSVALGTDTAGNYISGALGTANEVTITHAPGEASTFTASLPLTIDLGGKTSLELPNSAGPVTDAFGEVAGDNNAWAASRGAIQAFDGTANTFLVGTLASDTPGAGQVPTFNTGGTITWETITGAGLGALLEANRLSEFNTESERIAARGNLDVLWANEAIGRDNDRAPRGGLFFDGLTSPPYITGSANSSLAIGTRDFTVVWMMEMKDWTPTTGQFFYSHNAGNNRFYMQVTSAGAITIEFLNAVGGFTTYTFTPDLPLVDGECYNFALAMDRDGLGTLYINGVSDRDKNGTGVTVSIAGTSTIDIGSGNTAPYYVGYNLQGFLLHSFAIYNRAFSLTDAAYFAHQGHPDPIDQWGSLSASYTSDFTSTVSPWGMNVDVTPTAVDGVSDGTTSKDDVMKLTTGTGTSSHIVSGVGLSRFKRYHVSFSYYIPSGQAFAKVRFGHTTAALPSTGFTIDGTTVGSWATASGVFGGTVGNNLYITLVTAADSVAFNGVAGEAAYVRDIVLTPVGAILDLDLERANPVVSSVVRDRSNSANHGTASTSIFQWLKTPQVNATHLFTSSGIDVTGIMNRGNFTNNLATANRVGYFDSAKVLQSHSTVSDTELGYLDGLTELLTTSLANKQASDTDLSAISALATSGILVRTGAGTAATRTITGDTEIVVVNGNGVSGDPVLSIGAGITRDAEAAAAYQPKDTDLTLVAAQVTTSYGLDFLELANASAARTHIGTVIGLDVQAYDSDLQAIAGVGVSGFIAKTGLGLAEARTITGDTEIVVVNGAGTLGNPTLSIGSAIARDSEVTAALASYQPLINLNASTLYGRGSAAGAGAGQEITLGSNLSMSGTTLNANFAIADGDKGDIVVSGSGTVWSVDANSVALGTDTTGNYVASITGTSLEIDTLGSGEGAAVTISLPASIDIGAHVSFELPNGTGPTTDVFGEIAGDSNAWAASRGAIQAFDGTGNTYLIGVVATDTPGLGQVPKFNAGGTITWEDDSAGGVSDGDKGDITVTGSGATWNIDANAVALGTDTAGNYMSGVLGTSLEIDVSHTPGESSTATISLPASIDLGGKVSFELPNGTGPTTDVFGEIAGDNNAWATGRGALQAFDGTANTFLVGVQSTDTPSAGQVPKYNTGGTITWENDSEGASYFSEFSDTTTGAETIYIYTDSIGVSVNTYDITLIGSFTSGTFSGQVSGYRNVATSKWDGTTGTAWSGSANAAGNADLSSYVSYEMSGSTFRVKIEGVTPGENISWKISVRKVAL